MLKIKNNVGGSGGATSGQYVWSKRETGGGPIIGYVTGETETDYPDGGWQDGAYYSVNNTLITIGRSNYENGVLFINPADTPIFTPRQVIIVLDDLIALSDYISRSTPIPLSLRFFNDYPEQSYVLYYDESQILQCVDGNMMDFITISENGAVGLSVPDFSDTSDIWYSMIYTDIH